MQYFLSIDLGTTGCRSILYDESLRELAISYEEYPLQTPQEHWVEQDAEDWWRLTCSTTRGAIRQAGCSAAEVRALSISSQGITLVPVDTELRPLCPALTWLDVRAQEQARQILRDFGDTAIFAHTGKHIDACYTHIKANANTKKQVKEQIPAAAKHYAKELMKEVNADREAHGKKPFDDDDHPTSPKKPKDNTSKKKLARRKKEKNRTVTKSVTDPDCGLFVKGEHKKQFAYEAHTACDGNGFVLETVVTPGNVHDSVAFDEVYDKVTEKFPQAETIVADAAYKTPHICKKVFDDGRVLSTAYKRPQTMKGGHEWWKYVYDEFYDCVICPEYQPLEYSTTNRDGYREYKSDPNICASCPTRELCTHSKDCVKTVQRHIWKDYEELADDARYTPVYQNLYKRRKETIERVFADAKEKHAMRYTQYRGLTQVTNWVKLKFAAMNLKKLAVWKWNDHFRRSLFRFFCPIYTRNPAAA